MPCVIKREHFKHFKQCKLHESKLAHFYTFRDLHPKPKVSRTGEHTENKHTATSSKPAWLFQAGSEKIRNLNMLNKAETPDGLLHLEHTRNRYYQS